MPLLLLFINVSRRDTLTPAAHMLHCFRQPILYYAIRERHGGITVYHLFTLISHWLFVITPLLYYYYMPLLYHTHTIAITLASRHCFVTLNTPYSVCCFITHITLSHFHIIADGHATSLFSLFTFPYIAHTGACTPQPCWLPVFHIWLRAP